VVLIVRYHLNRRRHP